MKSGRTIRPEKRKRDPEPEPDLPLANIDAERGLVAAACTWPGLAGRIGRLLAPEDFYNDNCQVIYKATLALAERGIDPDIVTVTEELRRTGAMTTVADRRDLYYEITSQIAHPPMEHQAIRYALTVKEYALKRKLRLLSFDPDADVFSEMERIRAEIDAIGMAQRSSRKTLGELLIDRIATYEQSITYKEQGIPQEGIQTGLIAVDALVGGFQPTDLVVLAARPSMGKTGMAIKIIRNTIVDFGKRVLFFTIEMSAEQIVDRLLSAEARVESTRLRSGHVFQHELKQVADAALRFAAIESRLVIEDCSTLHERDFSARCRQEHAREPFDLIVIDYAQKMTGEGENRQQQVGSAIRAAKRTAKELVVPTLALAQVNRESAKRGQAPGLPDLLESGWIEQEADIVMFIHRPEYYGIPTDDEARPTEGIAEIIVAKNRNGATGTARIAFLAQYASFENLAFVDQVPLEYYPSDVSPF